ncbi:MAG: lipocalin family protein [Bacteroidetes bacterium]|nr:lipocalin family protein [Bacteroidota bacterium]
MGKVELFLKVFRIQKFHCRCVGISQNEPDQFTTNDVERLLALDTGKIWITTSLKIDGDEILLSDCEFHNYYYFFSTISADTLFYSGSDTICNTLKQDTLARFSWQVMGNLRGQFSDSIKLTDESGGTAFRTVRSVTAKILEWEYEDNESLYREELGWFTGEFK